ncbi:MAG: helix-turn-helix transcriptional regulator [Dorea sp.]|nr:helix-turn-helix transcriptional regulator [Dorea sp.]
MEELKLIDRVQFNEIPLHAEYSLTKSGKAMHPIFYEMIMWEKKYINKKTQTFWERHRWMPGLSLPA